MAGDEDLLRGVRLIHMPGHTPGSMALLVELDHAGSLLLADDALYTHESYGPPPVGSPMNPIIRLQRVVDRRKPRAPAPTPVTPRRAGAALQRARPNTTRPTPQ